MFAYLIFFDVDCADQITNNLCCIFLNSCSIENYIKLDMRIDKLLILYLTEKIQFITITFHAFQFSEFILLFCMIYGKLGKVLTHTQRSA